MFTAQRAFVNFATIQDPTALVTALGNGTFLGGEVILWRFTTRWYATVNAGGTAITLATA